MSEVEATNYIKYIQYIIPFITLLIGAWIGNKYAVLRERRNRFLAITTPIHDVLSRQVSSSGDDIFKFRVENDDLIKLGSRYKFGGVISRYHYSGYKNAVKKYQELGESEDVRDEYNNVVHTIYSDHNEYRKSILNLLRYTPIQ